MRAARLGAVLLAVALAACSQGAPSAVKQTPPAGGGEPAAQATPSALVLRDALASGIYVDRILVPACYQANPPIPCPDYDGPHYFVSLTATGRQAFRGALSWVAQDGNTFAVFTFAGTSQSGTAVLTVQSVGAPEPGQRPPQPVRPGSVVNAEFGSAQSAPSGLDASAVMVLDGCGNYLSLVETRGDCEFFYSPGGNL